MVSHGNRMRVAVHDQCGVVFLLNLARFDASWQRGQLSFDPVGQTRCRAFAFATAVVAIGFDTALRLCRWWPQNAFLECLPRSLQFAKARMVESTVD